MLSLTKWLLEISSLASNCTIKSSYHTAVNLKVYSQLSTHWKFTGSKNSSSLTSSTPFVCAYLLHDIMTWFGNTIKWYNTATCNVVVHLYLHLYLHGKNWYGRCNVWPVLVHTNPLKHFGCDHAKVDPPPPQFCFWSDTLAVILFFSLTLLPSTSTNINLYI